MRRNSKVLAILLTMLAIFGGTFWYLTRRNTRAVTGDLPESFPMVVFTTDPGGKSFTPHVVFAGKLEEFRRRKGAFSYVAPDLPEAQQGRNLTADLGCRDWEGFARFTVHAEGPGRQRFKVEANCNSDYENVGRYLATRAGISEAVHTKYFGPGVVIGSLMAIEVVSVAFAACWGLFWFVRIVVKSYSASTATGF